MEELFNMETKQQQLAAQIQEARKTIRSDSYAISIGELVSQYENREINIRPEFQRFIRWSTRQKSRLIESILLGIPLPSIFVLERQDSVWELIDGLQRMSTILHFMGVLRPEDSNKEIHQLRLEGTEYLPALEGVTYDGDGNNSLNDAQRRALKRAKMHVTILLPESDERARGELFDRLNAGGSQATPQEIRYARFVMEDPSFSQWITELSQVTEFIEISSVTTRQREQAYDVELICRFITLYMVAEEELRRLDTIDDLMTDAMLTLLSVTHSETEEEAASPAGRRSIEFRSSVEIDREKIGKTFKRTVKLLFEAVGPDVFRPYNEDKGRFQGAFSVSAFEFIMCGVAENVDYWESFAGPDGSTKLAQKIQLAWSEERFRDPSGSGKAARDRMKHTIPFGREYFAPPVGQ